MSTLTSLQDVSEQLHRQERLIHAAEQMKGCLRTTISGLQDKNLALEVRVKHLEAELARR